MDEAKKLYSPNPDVSKSALEVVSEAQTYIKELIIKGVLNGEDKKAIEKAIVNELKKVKKYKGFNIAVKQRIISSLQRFAQTQYYVFSQNMITINNAFLLRALANPKDKSYKFDVNEIFKGNTSANITEEKFRNFVTDNDKGRTLIKDYQKVVRQEIQLLAKATPKVVSYYQMDKEGNLTGKKIEYTMSARNLAEMTARYQANMNEIQEFKNKGVKLAWCSSHADASKNRCDKWQGKLYSLDGTSGVIDGISYEPLENAINDNGGNGLFGYNCRHYLIEYQSGMKAPKEYTEAEMKVQRKIDQKQRNYENRIRQMKTMERLLRASGDKAQIKKAQAIRKRWQQATQDYEVYSLENDRAFYLWRTRILPEEEEQKENDN